jgi:hypothetical protein
MTQSRRFNHAAGAWHNYCIRKEHLVKISQRKEMAAKKIILASDVPTSEAGKKKIDQPA